MNQRYLRAPDAAAYLGVSLPALYRKVHRRPVPCIKNHRSVRFEIRALDRWISEGAQEVLTL